jgi:hypothetical protein
MSCLACAQPTHEIARETYEVRALGRRIDVVFGVCELCGLLQQTPPLDAQTLALYYRNSLQLRTTDVSPIEREVFVAQAAFMGELRGKRVLEVGADMGQFLDHLADLGAHTFHDEAAATPIAHPKDDGGAYDLVVARHVLEHMAEPRVWLQSLRTESLFVEVPDWTVIDAHTDGLAFEHTAYFSFASLQILLARTGFAITRHETAITPGYPTSHNRVLRVLAVQKTRRQQVDDHLAAQRRPYEKIAALPGRVAIYGASWRSQEALRYAKNIVAIFDQDPRKHGGIVHPPSEIARIAPDVIVILSAYEQQIRAQLKDFAGRILGDADLKT